MSGIGIGNGTATGTEEEKFQRDIRSLPWYREFVKQYGEAPDLSKNADYDYRAAMAAGIRPERNPHDQNRYHWPSALPSGGLLKAPNHPTLWKEHYMRATGVDPDASGATEADWQKMNSGLLRAQ